MQYDYSPSHVVGARWSGSNIISEGHLICRTVINMGYSTTMSGINDLYYECAARVV